MHVQIKDTTSAWVPVMAVEPIGNKLVMKVSGWTGGSGAPPATNLCGIYIGANGYTQDVNLAVDISASPSFSSTNW